jgi:UDP-N-acetylmuramyl-tripeptide synthetase
MSGSSARFPARSLVTSDQQAAAARVADWLRKHTVSSSHLRTDSRLVQSGDAFMALRGQRTSGAAYVDRAIGRGAAALVIQASNLQGVDVDPAVPCLPVPELGALKAAVACDFYGNPSAELACIGVTGTNGKTSTVHWISQILQGLGVPCASVGTLGFSVQGRLHEEDIHLTTPDAVNLQRMARLSLDAGARALAMEVSSIGLEQGRVDGMHLRVGVYTNLSQDHLDYHGSMDAYAKAKRALFDWPGMQSVVLNLNDEQGLIWQQELTDSRADAATVIGYAQDTADLRATQAGLGLPVFWFASALQHSALGMSFTLTHHRDGVVQGSWVVQTALHGAYNVSNLLAALAACVALGHDAEACLATVGVLRSPPGRLDVVALDGSDVNALPMVVVDYAHTPDAIAKALDALRPVAARRGGHLTIVFGAGGDRDPLKRPLMGRAASDAADQVVITSDNPRTEEPLAIIRQIQAGVADQTKLFIEPDRAVAIQGAVMQANASDVILLAGKGHEETQEIEGEFFPFSDREQARLALRARLGAARS